MTTVSDTIPSFWNRELSRREVWVYRAIYLLPVAGSLIAGYLARLDTRSPFLLPELAGVLAHILDESWEISRWFYSAFFVLTFFLVPKMSMKQNFVYGLMAPLPFCLVVQAVFGEPNVGAFLFFALCVSYFYALPGALAAFLYSRHEHRKQLPGYSRTTA
ncbi:MAG: hypothetical protein M3O22_08790 [Pseudomonadota bacterium]|nr:hypothetical protein [Pseudomonadota bacterium]